MAYTVMYMRPQPDDLFWASLREQPLVALALATWAAVLLAVGTLIDFESLLAVLAVAF